MSQVKEATRKDYLQVRQEGRRAACRWLRHYRLDTILAAGCRVRCRYGAQFRQWVAARLSEYLVKDYVMDVEQLKNPCNKMRWVTCGHTAAEIIHGRADAAQPFMGPRARPGGLVQSDYASMAKSYVTVGELQALNRIIKPMRVQKLSTKFDDYLKTSDRQQWVHTGQPHAANAGPLAALKYASSYKQPELQLLRAVVQDFEQVVAMQLRPLPTAKQIKHARIEI